MRVGFQAVFSQLSMQTGLGPAIRWSTTPWIFSPRGLPETCPWEYTVGSGEFVMYSSLYKYSHLKLCHQVLQPVTETAFLTYFWWPTPLISLNNTLVSFLQGDRFVLSWLSGWLCCLEYYRALHFGWRSDECSAELTAAVLHAGIPRTVPLLLPPGPKHCFSLRQVRYRGDNIWLNENSTLKHIECL